MKIKILSIICCMLLLIPVFSIVVAADNNPPNPPVIEGPTSGKIKETHTYNVAISDPDEDDLLIKIEINFGDGTTSCGGCDGRGPWSSGDIVKFNHSWTKTGTFGIKGRVQDEHGVWSEWSEPFNVSMPVSKNTNRFPFTILDRLLGKFLLFEKIIDIIKEINRR